MSSDEERIAKLEADAVVSEKHTRRLHGEAVEREMHVAELDRRALERDEHIVELDLRALARDEQILDLIKEVDGLHLAKENASVIEQAKGVIMSTTGCGPDAAFAVLVATSQRENRKLRDIAAQLAASQEQQDKQDEQD